MKNDNNDDNTWENCFIFKKLQIENCIKSSIPQVLINFGTQWIKELLKNSDEGTSKLRHEKFIFDSNSKGLI